MSFTLNFVGGAETARVSEWHGVGVIRLMKAVALALLLAAVAPGSVSAYTLSLTSGETGHNTVAFPVPPPFSVGGYHWDSFSVNWDPVKGQSYSALQGNDYRLGTTLTLLAEPGDPATAVQIMLHYQLTESVSLSFDNYQTTTYDYHYAFKLALTAPGEPTLTYDLPSDSTSFVFEMEPGTSMLMEFLVDPAAVHASHDNELWKPTVIDPSIPGVASLNQISGMFTPIRADQIPEPTVSSIVLAGLCILGVRGYGRRNR